MTECTLCAYKNRSNEGRCSACDLHGSLFVETDDVKQLKNVIEEIKQQIKCITKESKS